MARLTRLCSTPRLSARVSHARFLLAMGTFVTSLGAARADAAVRINEVVADPARDWGTDSADTAFLGVPGTGAVTAGDEWIELVNTGSAAVSLAGYSLEMADATPVTDTLGTAPDARSYRVFDAAGQHVADGPDAMVPPGGRMVIGDPTGDMAVGVPLTLTLRDAAGAVVDQATFGAAPAADLDAAGTFDEAAARLGDGSDVDSPLDFAKTVATLGAANPTPCALPVGAVRINEVVADPVSNWDHSDGSGARDTAAADAFFTALPGGTVDSADEFVELKNTSLSAQDLRGCVLAMADATPAHFVLGSAAGDEEPWVRVFDQAGTALPDSALGAVPAGGYVVIGDVPGQMQNGSEANPLVVSLHAGGRGGDAVDRVAFGSPDSAGAPGLSSSSMLDEAVARYPDGRAAGMHDFATRAATPGASNGDITPAAAGDALLNELVIDPQADYSGDGALTSSDQWVELVNTSGAVIDLTGWTLWMVDTTPAVALLSEADVTFSAGGNVQAWQPGEYLVVLNPLGQMNRDVFVQLRDATDTVVDTVEIGLNDLAGDGDDLAAPGDGANASAVSVGASAIARMPDGQTTGDDAADFARQPPTLAQVSPPVGLVNTAPVANGQGPVVVPGQSTSGMAVALDAVVQLAFSEPLAPAAVTDALVTVREAGQSTPLGGDLRFALGNDAVVELVPHGLLKPGTTYELFVAGGVRDWAGEAAPAPGAGPVHTFTTEPAAQNPAPVQLSEIVVHPLADYGSQGFTTDTVTGGTANASDEWVELVNTTGAAVDLSAWTLSFVDDDRARLVLADGVYACFAADGSHAPAGACITALAPGGRVVFGDVPGSMDPDIALVLRDSTGALVDMVEIGGLTASTDRGGDGEDNGAPGAGLNGRALHPLLEAVARTGGDTGDDLADFAAQPVTLGRDNTVMWPVDTTPPAVERIRANRTVNGDARVDTDFVVTFDEPVDIRGLNWNAFTLEVDGQSWPLRVLADTAESVRVSPEQALPFGASVLVGVQPGAVRDFSRNPGDANALAAAASDTFTTEGEPASPGALRINEVVAEPVQDWNDSILGPGVPFDAEVGRPFATAGDEWVEIKNTSADVVDVSTLVLAKKDRTYSETPLGAREDSVVRRATGGDGQHVPAGGLLVLGDIDGSMAKTVFLGIRDSSGALIDATYVQPADPLAAASEAWARQPGSADTGVDWQDFCLAEATILAENTANCTQTVMPPPPPDAGMPDAGPADGGQGTPDAGQGQRDAGQGQPDAGPGAPDAGPILTVDAGSGDTAPSGGCAQSSGGQAGLFGLALLGLWFARRRP